MELKSDRVKAVRSDGSEAAAREGDGRGRREYFRTAEGGAIPQVVEPRGFDPKKASAEELDTYGYPERPPATSPERAEWDRVWGAKVSGPRGAGYCEVRGLRGTRAAQPRGPRETSTFREASLECSATTAGSVGTPSQCWSRRYGGAMRTGGPGSFKKANMGWYQTNYRSQASGPCPRPSYFTWTGFGGFDNKLMQAGTVSSTEIPGTDNGHSAMFWEVISVDPDDPDESVVGDITYIFTYGDQGKALVEGGDDTRVYIAYDQPNHAGEAILTVKNVTENEKRSTGWLSYLPVGGQLFSASKFYDGRTVGFFTEGGLPPESPIPSEERSIREPYYGETRIYFTKANAKYLTGFPTVKVNHGFPTGARFVQTSMFANSGDTAEWDVEFEFCR